MKIVIVGAGVVGLSLAEEFCQQRHLVSIIDIREDICEKINASLDVLAVTGSGSSPSVLESAGIKDADMIIAVTPSDETNLVICSLASQYGVQKRIARIQSEEFTRRSSVIDLRNLGVTHVIEPEKEVVQSILQYIELQGVTEAANFQDHSIYLRGYKLTASMPFCGRNLAEINQLSGADSLLIFAIIRNGQSLVPTGSLTLLDGDEIIAIMPREALPAFKKLLGKDESKLKKIIISGDTLTAIHLAEETIRLADRVILVDPDITHAKLAAELLDRVEVMNGDCTNVEIFSELHIETADFFIAATKDTEDNVMSCLLAKAEGAREVITIANSDRHLRLFHSLGLDHIINPRKITVQTIISNVLKFPIRAHLGTEKVDLEVVRINAGEKSKIINTPLKQLDTLFKVKKAVIIGAIIRDEQVIIPKGDTEIKAGDEVFVICKQEHVAAVKHLFR